MTRSRVPKPAQLPRRAVNQIRLAQGRAFTGGPAEATAQHEERRFQITNNPYASDVRGFPNCSALDRLGEAPNSRAPLSGIRVDLGRANSPMLSQPMGGLSSNPAT